MDVWQSSRPARFSPAGLTLWPKRLEGWVGHQPRFEYQWGCRCRDVTLGGSSAGLGKAQRIDHTLRADWLSRFSLAWWEWRVARQGCLVPSRKGVMWQSGRLASFSPAGLTLWSNRLERRLATLSRISTQVRIPAGLSVPGRYRWIIISIVYAD